MVCSNIISPHTHSLHTVRPAGAPAFINVITRLCMCVSAYEHPVRTKFSAYCRRQKTQTCENLEASLLCNASLAKCTPQNSPLCNKMQTKKRSRAHHCNYTWFYCTPPPCCTSRELCIEAKHVSSPPVSKSWCTRRFRRRRRRRRRLVVVISLFKILTDAAGAVGFILYKWVSNGDADVPKAPLKTRHPPTNAMWLRNIFASLFLRESSGAMRDSLLVVSALPFLGRRN